MTVYLVGAGPGDPGLLTVRAAEVLAAADVVVHDRLAESSLLELAPASAERFDVGKTPGGPVDQESINALLIERGRAGQSVVRLKGGDPFVFGRGGEEALALTEAGVPFEVIPGISSAVAVPAYAGVPVTHRGLSASFTVVTGHSRQEVEVETNWEAIAQSAGTVVILMGVAHRAEIARRLMSGGLAPETPVVATTWGTRPDQRSVRTTLAALGDAVMEPPAVMVIGAVAGLDLRWFEDRPLLGRRVVVTRSRDQASALVARLRSLGADVIEVPTIAIGLASDGGQALAAATIRLDRYDWIAFTSTNAVEAVFEHLRDARAFGRARVAAVGMATADALRARGVDADLVPERFEAAALVEAFPSGAGRVLLPQGSAARPTLENGLLAKGWQVDVVEAYRTESARPSDDVLKAAAGADAITFTSSSTIRGWIAAAGSGRTPATIVCIGAQTAATAAEHGLTVTAVADPSTIDGLARAVVATLAS